MANDGKKIGVSLWVPGEDITAKKLNEAPMAILEMTRGVNVGVNSTGQPYAIDIPPQYTRARVVLTDSAVTRQGLLTVDGVILKANDYVLVATGAAPGNDGLYMAAQGQWLQLARLNFNQVPNDDTPVLPHGCLIGISEGTSGPFAWRAGADALGPTF